MSFDSDSPDNTRIETQEFRLFATSFAAFAAGYNIYSEPYTLSNQLIARFYKGAMGGGLMFTFMNAVRAIIYRFSDNPKFIYSQFLSSGIISCVLILSKNLFDHAVMYNIQ